MTGFGDEDDEDARDEVARLIRGSGLRIAVQAAIDVAADRHAPAPARATAAGLIIRAAGLFERPADDEDKVQPHEMSPKQLERALTKARARADALERPKKPGSVFD